MSFTARICILAFSFLILIASFCNSYRPGSEIHFTPIDLLMSLAKQMDRNGVLMCFISSLQLSQALKAFSPPSLGVPTRKELQHIFFTSVTCHVRCL